MKKDDGLRRLIIKDCTRAMLLNVIVYTIGDLLESFLVIYSSSVLGNFADAVFNLDLHSGLTNFWYLLIGILTNIFLVPLIGMGGEVTMFSNALRHDRYVMGRFLDKTYQSAMSIEPGEAQSRLEDDPTELRCSWVEMLEKLILTPVTLAYLLYNTLKISIPFTAVVFLISLIKLIVPIVVRRTQAKFDIQNREYRTSVRACEIEITQKPYLIKLYGLKNGVISRLDSLYQTFYKDVVCRSSKYNTISSSILSFLDPFCIVMILLIGALMVSKGSITAGFVAAMIGYFAVFNTVIGNIDHLIRNLPILNNNIERMKILYNDQEEINGGRIECVRRIEVRDVSFSYRDTPVFDHITFSVKKGEKVAIAGVNGSGKSTFMMILCGLLKGYNGSIKIDGKELKEISHNAWRDCFALITQEPYLFEGSVVESIRLGNLSATQADVLGIMEKLNIGYLADRMVSFQEKSLSGGEKQRISIARALLTQRDILLFDEPSNNLDSATVEWIGNFIEECPQTVIYVSHDIGLIRKSDKCIHLSGE